MGFQQLAVETAVWTMKSGFKTVGGLSGAGRSGAVPHSSAPGPNRRCRAAGGPWDIRCTRVQQHGAVGCKQKSGPKP